MKRFRFALQPVLDQRQRIEDEKQMVVAQKRRSLDEAEAGAYVASTRSFARTLIFCAVATLSSTPRNCA